MDNNGVHQIVRNCKELEALSVVNVAVSQETAELLASYGRLKLLDIGASDILEEITAALQPKGVHVVRLDQTRQSPSFDLVYSFDFDWEHSPIIVF